MARGNDLRRIPNKTLSTQTRQYGYIQSFTKTKTDRGDFTTAWANTSASPHAMAIIPMSARQKLEFMSINVEATHIIKIRGEISVQEKDRVLYGSRIFEILTVEDIQERGIVKWLTCKEER